eukprot:scaffold154936_cov30-Tisochrysis_lutea.AAC.5
MHASILNTARLPCDRLIRSGTTNFILESNHRCAIACTRYLSLEICPTRRTRPRSPVPSTTPLASASILLCAHP